MSEPKARAKRIQTVVPGILNWHVHDDRIDSRSDAHAIRRATTSVLIDPLPLSRERLDRLGAVEAICLTGSCHQRSAWRFRRILRVPVFAPKGADGLEEDPDETYRGGDVLPGGLEAIHAPGPTRVHFAFYLARGRGALFCADILMNDGRAVRFIDPDYQDEPKRARTTARAFLERRFSVLCFDHGAPVTRGAHASIRKALATPVSSSS